MLPFHVMKRERAEPKIRKNVFTPIHHPFLFSSVLGRSSHIPQLPINLSTCSNIITKIIISSSSFFLFWYFHSFIYLVTPQQLRPKQTTDSRLKLTRERETRRKNAARNIFQGIISSRGRFWSREGVGKVCGKGKNKN